MQRVFSSLARARKMAAKYAEVENTEVFICRSAWMTGTEYVFKRPDDILDKGHPSILYHQEYAMACKLKDRPAVKLNGHIELIPGKNIGTLKTISHGKN